MYHRFRIHLTARRAIVADPFSSMSTALFANHLHELGPFVVIGYFRAFYFIQCMILDRFDCITIMFLERGHSFNECDRDQGLWEQQIRKHGTT